MRLSLFFLLADLLGRLSVQSLSPLRNESIFQVSISSVDPVWQAESRLRLPFGCPSNLNDAPLEWSQPFPNTHNDIFKLKRSFRQTTRSINAESRSHIDKTRHTLFLFIQIKTVRLSLTAAPFLSKTFSENTDQQNGNHLQNHQSPSIDFRSSTVGTQIGNRVYQLLRRSKSKLFSIHFTARSSGVSTHKGRVCQRSFELHCTNTKSSWTVWHL